MNDKIKHNFIGYQQWVFFIIIFFSLLLFSSTYAQNKQVRIGVLALRGAEESMQRWSPTADYLTDQIPGYTFVIVPLDFEQIFEAVKDGSVDFALENSSIYVELEYLYGIDRIATLNALCRRKATNQFGGIIFTTKNRNDINIPDDLKDKSFMAVDETSFGGWRMSQREFKDLGIDPYHDFESMQFGGTHDQVVYAVQKGEVDAGTVRTGILEKMDKEGKIDIADFKILNQQYPENFSLLISTRLYPEWPFAKVKHTSDQLALQVSIALLSMPSDSKAAIAAAIAGWTIPHDYQPVHDCLKELRVSPYKDLGKITLVNLIEQYWEWILLLFISVIILVVVVIYINRLNRKLELTTIELKNSHNRLEQKVEERTSELRQSNKELIRESKDRKQAEEAIVASEQKYRTLFDGTFDIVLSITPAGNISSWNKRAEEVFGYTANEIIGKNTSVLVPKELLNKQKEIITKVKESGFVEGLESIRVAKDGTRIPVEMTVSTMKDRDGNLIGLSAIIRDITQRKQAEDELKKHRNHLEEMVKERTKDIESFTYSVSHDLRAPLRAISGFSEILLDEYKDKLDDEAQRLIKVIRKNALNMNQLIADLLNFSRLGRQKIKTVNINMKTLAGDVFDELRQEYLKHDIKFKLGEIPPAMGDSNLIRLVFANLIVNALKFSQNEKEPEIEISSMEKDKQLFYYVKDNGVGFEMEYVDKIFGVFQRLHTSEDFEGTGVGLAIVQKIIQKHSGKVWAEGEVDKGATFYFSLKQK